MAPLGIERGERLPEGARGTQTTKRQWLASTARKWKNRDKVISALDRREAKLKEKDGRLLRQEVRLSEGMENLARREEAFSAKEAALAEEAKAVRADCKANGRAVSLGTVKASERTVLQVEDKPKRKEKRARRKPKVSVDVR